LKPSSSKQAGAESALSALSFSHAGGRDLASLKQEIAQQKPFAGVAEEALLNLLRTADAAGREVQRLVKPWGVTSTQYNVLRILRGAQPQGLTCSAIGARMITADPDITRLLARLKAMKLVRQQRDKNDRRVVWTQIVPAGLKLLDQIHPTITHFPDEFFARLSESEQAELIRLLELTRSACPASEASCPTCDGRHKE
jgi:DNA-binding MarR family transcriptional regulator